MKHFIFLLLLLCFSSNANAADSFFSFAAGTASGAEDVAISAPEDKYDHDLKGDASILTFGSFSGGGWGWSVGYHDYLIEGETKVFGVIPSLQWDQTLFSRLHLSGPYLGFGYRLGDKFSFTPQVRIGVNNQIALDRTLTIYNESAPVLEFTQKSDERKNIVLVVFPFEVMLGNRFSLGAEYHIINLDYSSEDELFGDSTKVTLQSAVMASVSIAF